MRRASGFAFFALIASIALTGCETHRGKVDRLQKEYQQESEQFGKDCSAEYMKVPPTLSQKCTDENAKMKRTWDELQAERAKQ